LRVPDLINTVGKLYSLVEQQLKSAPSLILETTTSTLHKHYNRVPSTCFLANWTNAIKVGDVCVHGIMRRLRIYDSALRDKRNFISTRLINRIFIARQV